MASEIKAADSRVSRQVEDEKPSVAEVDLALEFLRETEHIEYTVEEERALVRKIDWMILPLLFLVYCAQFTDKNLINFANIMGLGVDTNTSPQQFSNLAWVFYLSYLACEPISGYLLQKLPVAKFLGLNVSLWGLCLAMNCVCKNYASLVALRVLLGVFEACVSPSLILICAMWYRRKEQPLRIGFCCGAVGVGIIVGALSSYGFQHYHGSQFRNWQIMFLIFGLVTIVIGISVAVFLPDNPMKSRLSDREKAIAVLRLRSDTTGVENKTFKPAQFFEALRDPHAWLIIVITIAINIPNAAVSIFQAAIIQSFGYTAEQTALLSIPSGVFSFIAIGGASYTSYRFNTRFIPILLLLIAGVIGGSLMAFLPGRSKTGALIGTYLTNTIPSCTPILYSWVAANFAGHTKKVTMSAALLMAFCLGNILGPLTFTNPPVYTAAKITIIAVIAFAIVMTLILVYIYQRENKKRSLNMETEMGRQFTNEVSFLDLTDRSIPEFRYIL